jgi:hypothetical protein
MKYFVCLLVIFFQSTCTFCSVSDTSVTRGYAGFDQLLSDLYQFTTEEQWLPKENKYGVVGVSTFAIQSAVVEVLKSKVSYIGGEKDRPWILKKKEYLNDREGLNEKLIQIVNEGYINDSGRTIDEQEIVLVDATWLPTMQKPFTQDGEVYFFSGTYLTFQNVKVSFAFFKNKELAKCVQERVSFISTGVSLLDFQTIENTLSNKEKLKSKFRANKKTLTCKCDFLKNEVSEFNSSKGSSLVLSIEPAMHYAYLSGDTKDLDLFLKKFAGEKEGITVLNPTALYHPHKKDRVVFNLSAWKEYGSSFFEEVDIKKYNTPETYNKIYDL